LKVVRVSLSPINKEKATAMERIALKLEIKQWENGFKTKEGRNPTREDIKRDVAIGECYRMICLDTMY
jgi:hypothetical protein